MECLHTDTVEYPQTFKNGTVHIRLECANCNSFIKWKPKPLDDFKLWFGKYKNEKLKHIPNDYLLWYIRNGKDQKLIKKLNEYLFL